MNETCPFCWDRNVRPVGRIARNYAKGKSQRLMECPACEKWYWSGTEEEVPRLFEICATAIVNPGRCYGEIREALNSGGTETSPCRVGEFNWLCGQCPNSRFMAGKVADHPALALALSC